MSESLYEIAGDILKIAALIEDAESDEGLAEAVAGALEESELALTDKINNIMGLLQNWERTAHMIKMEENRLKERRVALEAKAAHLRAYTLTHLQRIDKRKVVAPLATMSIRKGSESVVIDDDMTLPQGYYTSEYVVQADRAGLKKLWKETPEAERDALPGFHVERGADSLQIR